MRPVIDPRSGDIEDDASSTKRRSLLSLAGTLLSEISLPKLVMAWMLMLVGSVPVARAIAAHRLGLDRQDLGNDRVSVSPDSGRRPAVCCSRSAGFAGKAAVASRRAQLLVVELPRRRA